jgi:hypothetical protein
MRLVTIVETCYLTSQNQDSHSGALGEPACGGFSLAPLETLHSAFVRLTTKPALVRNGVTVAEAGEPVKVRAGSSVSMATLSVQAMRAKIPDVRRWITH